MNILEISNLQVETEGKKILNDFNLSIKDNEIHIIMGPNGSGKSTLAKALAGHPNYSISKGDIFFLGENLKTITIEERVKKGLFLAFQSPIEVAGLTNFDFFHLIYNEQQKYNSKNELSPIEFYPIIQNLFKKVNINEEFLYRNLNEGFSGGEKKKNEILQLLLLQPKLVILDEIDSGLDIDALKKICQILKNEKNLSLLVITHYPKIIELLKPNFIHIFFDGKIQKTGGVELVTTVEKKGYDFFKF
jgi:Fe-S cluster assembly ATP-binding protein